MRNIWSYYDNPPTHWKIRYELLNYYFECPSKEIKFRGRKITLPIQIDNDILEAVKYHKRLQIRQFRTTEDLNTVRNEGKDYNEWKNLTILFAVSCKVNNETVLRRM